ncbi:hypothetical protein [Lactobacillus melliventris]|uniref:Surface layer protein A domain-containing protein n=1 Tax=Lactobacillus melliventris TaxID=1218507 RepID=A0A0F4LCE0_9LACO|nr:hypothetical protein [Lactobacillus melliventris]KJY56280.1 hypothetical protein JF74_13600 [Lactobacillus melliventris]
MKHKYLRTVLCSAVTLFSFTALANSTVVKAENIDTAKSVAVNRATDPVMTVTSAKRFSKVFKLVRNTIVYPTVNDVINDTSKLIGRSSVKKMADKIIKLRLLNLVPVELNWLLT